MNGIFSEIEKPLKELEKRIEALKEIDGSVKTDFSAEIAALELKAAQLKKEIYENLSPWDRVAIARHPERPVATNYVEHLFDSFFELHGDRRFADDPAVIAGIASFEGQSVLFFAHKKGRTTSENIANNFGMPEPEGFRKAQRAMELAARFKFPVIALIDTPGAYPGTEAEERGQAQAIAESMSKMFSLPVPIISVIIGEGGSGGALAFGVADRVLILENAIYSVISPEGCAAILWHDAKLAPKATELLRLTAQDLKKLGIADAIIEEPQAGAHTDPEFVYSRLRAALSSQLAELKKLSISKLQEQRYRKFRSIGIFEESNPA